MNFLVFNLLGVCCSARMCRLMFYILVGKVLAVIYSNTFPAPFSSLFSFWYYKTYILLYFMISHILLRLFPFLLYIIHIAIPFVFFWTIWKVALSLILGGVIFFPFTHCTLNFSHNINFVPLTWPLYHV